jgi:hypothetical protein
MVDQWQKVWVLVCWNDSLYDETTIPTSRERVGERKSILTLYSNVCLGTSLELVAIDGLPAHAA